MGVVDQHRDRGFGAFRHGPCRVARGGHGATWTYGHDQKRSSIENIDNNPGFPGLYPSGQVLESNYSDSNVSPEVTLSWHPESDQTSYAAYKTGYKSGGISNAFLVYANATPQNVQFRPEKSRGGEIGYKATMLDRRLRFNVTAYHYNYDDLQVVSYDAQTINFSIGNAASARIQGVEGEFDWLALQDLTFLGNVGFNHARYQSYPNAQCFAGQTAAQGCNPATSEQDLSGKPLLRAPNLTYSLGAEYKLHFASHWSAAFSLQGTWSDSYQTASDYSPGGLQNSYWLLNAAVRAAYDVIPRRNGCGEKSEPRRRCTPVNHRICSVVRRSYPRRGDGRRTELIPPGRAAIVLPG